MQVLIILMFVTIQFYIYQVFDIGGTYGVTSLDIVTGIFYIIFLKKMFWNGEKLNIGWNQGLIFIGMFLLTIIISGITPLRTGNYEFLGQYLKSTVHIFFLCFFTIICASYYLKPEIWTKMIKVWLILSILINLFGIYQLPARAFDWPLSWIPITNVSMGMKGKIDVSEIGQLSLHWGNFYRATSIFSEPSALAAYNTITFIFLFIPIVQKNKPFLKSKIINIILWIITLAGLILTFSLTGVVGVLFMIMGIILFENFRKIISLMKIIVIIILLFIISDIFVTSYAGISLSGLFMKRIEGIISNDSVMNRGTEGESFFYRLDNLKTSVRVWEKHPFIGTGLGLTYSDKDENMYYSVSSIAAALAELGIFGFLTFLFLFISIFNVSLKFIIHPDQFKSLSDDEKRLMGLTFYLMINLFIDNFVSGNNLSTSSLWVPLGMVLAIINSIYLKKGNDGYVVTIMKKPLKVAFTKIMSMYIHNKEIKKLN